MVGQGERGGDQWECSVLEPEAGMRGRPKRWWKPASCCGGPGAGDGAWGLRGEAAGLCRLRRGGPGALDSHNLSGRRQWAFVFLLCTLLN